MNEQLNVQSRIITLSFVLCVVMLLVWPFFWSGATATQILTQPDFILSFLVFIGIAIGLRLNVNNSALLNKIWAAFTLLWLFINCISIISRGSTVKIIGAESIRPLFVADELWMFVLVAIMLAIPSLAIYKSLRPSNSSTR